MCVVGKIVQGVEWCKSIVVLFWLLSGEFNFNMCGFSFKKNFVSTCFCVYFLREGGEVGGIYGCVDFSV